MISKIANLGILAALSFCFLSIQSMKEKIVFWKEIGNKRWLSGFHSSGTNLLPAKVTTIESSFRSNAGSLWFSLLPIPNCPLVLSPKTHLPKRFQFQCEKFF